MTHQQMNTLYELLVCLKSWEPQVRVLGNVQAGEAATALETALKALEPYKNKSKLAFYPTEATEKFGSELMITMYDKHVTKALDGHVDLTDINPEFVPYVEAYLEGNNNSVAICYAAMRKKEEEG